MSVVSGELRPRTNTSGGSNGGYPGEQAITIQDAGDYDGPRPSSSGHRARRAGCLGFCTAGCSTAMRRITPYLRHSVAMAHQWDGADWLRLLLIAMLLLWWVVLLMLVMVFFFAIPWDAVSEKDARRDGWLAYIGMSLGMIPERGASSGQRWLPTLSPLPSSAGELDLGNFLDHDELASATAEQLLELSAWLSAIRLAMPDNGTRALAEYVLFEDGEQSAPAKLPSSEPVSGIPDERAERLLEHIHSSLITSQIQSVRSVWFIRASGLHRETESLQPFDDLEMIKYQYALLRAGWCAEQLNQTAHHRHPACSYGGVITSVATLLQLRPALYKMPSLLNRRFYYPLRRWESIAPYATVSLTETDAWHGALMQEAYYYLTGSSAEAEGGGLSIPYLTEDRMAQIHRYFSQEQQALMPRSDVKADTRTIFVSFASFRDVECGPTLTDMMFKAKNIHRVYVGVAEQNHHEVDQPCLPPELYRPVPCYSPMLGDDNVRDEDMEEAEPHPENNGEEEHRGVAAWVFTGYTPPSESRIHDFSRSLCFFHENVRIRRVRATQALGPTYGRFVAMLLYRGESMTVVLDSHNRFTPHWDTLGLHLYHKYEDPKTILSHYPAAYMETPGESFDFYQSSTAYLCRASFYKDYGYVRLSGILVRGPEEFLNNNLYNDPYVRLQAADIAPDRNFRMPQPWVAGGFLLGNASIYREVPFDPHLPYIFDGEEVLYSVRLWTHGYNIYSPERNLVFHFYGRPKAPKVWNEARLWNTVQEESRKRVRFLLRARIPKTDTLMIGRDTHSAVVTVDVERYGMGKGRTVEQWYHYAGADPVNGTLDGRWCGHDKQQQG